MCMICNSLDSMTIEQGISNLFEMMESLGKEHTNVVAEMLAVRICDEGVDNVYDSISPKHRKMFIALAKFVK